MSAAGCAGWCRPALGSLVLVMTRSKAPIAIPTDERGHGMAAATLCAEGSDRSTKS